MLILDLRREKEKALRRGEKPPTQVSQKLIMNQKEKMDEVCYQQCVKFLREKHQILVFVHSRNATGQLARTFMEKAAVANQRELFAVEAGKATQNSYLKAKKAMNNAQSQELQQLFQCGTGIHHAGLTRHDRHLMERMFADGAIRVMCCTATLALGVNLPAYAVIIRAESTIDMNFDQQFTLKVSNLPINITKRAVRSIFEDYDQVVDIHIPRDSNNSLLGVGLAFVRFSNPWDAEDAINYVNGRRYGSHTIKVTKADYKRRTGPELEPSTWHDPPMAPQMAHQMAAVPPAPSMAPQMAPQMAAAPPAPSMAPQMAPQMAHQMAAAPPAPSMAPQMAPQMAAAPPAPSMAPQMAPQMAHQMAAAPPAPSMAPQMAPQMAHQMAAAPPAPSMAPQMAAETDQISGGRLEKAMRWLDNPGEDGGVGLNALHEFLDGTHSLEHEKSEEMHNLRSNIDILANELADFELRGLSTVSRANTLRQQLKDEIVKLDGMIKQYLTKDEIIAIFSDTKTFKEFVECVQAAPDMPQRKENFETKSSNLLYCSGRMANYGSLVSYCWPSRKIEIQEKLNYMANNIYEVTQEMINAGLENMTDEARSNFDNLRKKYEKEINLLRKNLSIVIDAKEIRIYYKLLMDANNSADNSENPSFLRHINNKLAEIFYNIDEDHYQIGEFLKIGNELNNDGNKIYKISLDIFEWCVYFLEKCRRQVVIEAMNTFWPLFYQLYMHIDFQVLNDAIAYFYNSVNFNAVGGLGNEKRMDESFPDFSSKFEAARRFITWEPYRYIDEQYRAQCHHLSFFLMMHPRRFIKQLTMEAMICAKEKENEESIYLLAQFFRHFPIFVQHEENFVFNMAKYIYSEEYEKAFWARNLLEKLIKFLSIPPSIIEQQPQYNEIFADH